MNNNNKNNGEKAATHNVMLTFGYNVIAETPEEAVRLAKLELEKIAAERETTVVQQLDASVLDYTMPFNRGGERTIIRGEDGKGIDNG